MLILIFVSQTCRLAYWTNPSPWFPRPPAPPSQAPDDSPKAEGLSLPGTPYLWP